MARRAASRDVVGRILRFNAGREPERLGLKYQAMQSGAFRFFRGTCHLFCEDWPKRSGLDHAPHTWISGDLHLENFGTYKGDDRILYFDINDFDEAALAPCTWELARFTTSLLLAAREHAVPRRAAIGLARRFLDAYTEALGRGKARRVERLVAEGMVRELLDALLGRSRRALLESRTEGRGRRRLRLGKRALPVMRAQRTGVEALLGRFARTQSEPRFFRVLDVATRVAGTGSLGVPRFVILVEGRGSPDDNYLLDLKQARPSALVSHLPTRQPRWNNEAERVVAIQDRMQAVSPALLSAVTFGGAGFVLRELQPSADRLDLERWDGRIARLESVMDTMGRVAAWSQLRSGGRQGAAVADELVAFAGRAGWQTEVLRYAREYERQVEGDWRTFSAAMQRGDVRVPTL